MSARYIVTQSRNSRLVPRCDLPGSPFVSRKAAKQAAWKADIPFFKITSVRRAA